jgi:hypothetical protein
MPVTLVITPLAGVPSAGVVSVGLVSVLLVIVSVVARPTSVSVDVGSVRVPVLLIVLITGAVSVLFVSVSVVALPTRVSVAAGNVTVVVPATAVACNVVVPDVDPDRSIAFGLSVTVVAIIRPIKVCYSRRCRKAQ